MDTRTPPSMTTLDHPVTALAEYILVARPVMLEWGMVLRIGDECVHVLNAPADVVRVARGFGGTVATPHDRGTEVLILGVAYPDAPGDHNSLFDDPAWYQAIYAEDGERFTVTAVGEPAAWDHNSLFDDPEGEDDDG